MLCTGCLSLCLSHPQVVCVCVCVCLCICLSVYLSSTCLSSSLSVTIVSALQTAGVSVAQCTKELQEA